MNKENLPLSHFDYKMQQDIALENFKENNMLDIRRREADTNRRNRFIGKAAMVLAVAASLLAVNHGLSVNDNEQKSINAPGLEYKKQLESQGQYTQVEIPESPSEAVNDGPNVN